MSRVTADSNIFISAFLRGGKPLELLEMARAGQIELSVTDDILNEVGRVLLAKFGVSDEDVQAFRDEIPIAVSRWRWTALSISGTRSRIVATVARTSCCKRTAIWCCASWLKMWGRIWTSCSTQFCGR